MKTLTTLVATYLRSGKLRGNFNVLFRLIFVLFCLVLVYSVLFHSLMAYEGKQHSWLTGFYWTIVAMSTLGFGDITFQSDLGRMYSVVVVVSGMIFMLILLPFTFIQFFYAPWLEARDAARAPRELPEGLSGHVLLTDVGPIETALVGRLNQFRIPYVVLVGDMAEGLRLHDDGLRVMIGDLDDPATYRRARVDKALLVAATRSDPVNTNIAVTVREASRDVPIVATADNSDSAEILTLAGCQQVVEVADLLGKFMAQRVFAGDGRTHLVGQVDSLLIAEAWAARTSLVGKTLRDLKLPDRLGVTVGGVWQRGKFTLGGPQTTITDESVLLLAGTREQLDAYDAAFGVTVDQAAFVVIIGGGRVGLAAARALDQQGVDYRIVEKGAVRIADDSKLIAGDAADLDVLTTAGISRASCAIVTTHDDDINVYLTLYCRKLRPEMLVVSRATRERNTTTLHRAGADYVASYASIAANAIFNTLRDRSEVLVAEGLNVFTVATPAALVGRTLLDSQLRQDTGCNLLAIREGGALRINPEPSHRFAAGSRLVLIGDREAEHRFFERFKTA